MNDGSFSWQDDLTEVDFSEKKSKEKEIYLEMECK